MGLLDSILGSVLGGGQTQNSGQAALINALIQMMRNNSGGSGGLAGLVQSLTRGGLGHLANSWVSTGHNLPVSAEQLQNALGGRGGGNILEQLAQATGMSQEDTAAELSNVLPEVVDKLTPGGNIPQADTLENMLGASDIGR